MVATVLHSSLMKPLFQLSYLPKIGGQCGTRTRGPYPSNGGDAPQRIRLPMFLRRRFDVDP